MSAPVEDSAPVREIPNPITKAAEASNLPRQARARVGQTTDPLPEGKVLDAAPETYHKIEPAGHDVDRAKAGTTLTEMGLSEAVVGTTDAQELTNLQGMGGGSDAQIRKDLQAQQRPARNQNPPKAANYQDFAGSSTGANKQMDHRQRG